MDYQIREMKIEDYKDIYELNCQEMGYDYPIQDTKEKLIQLSQSHYDQIYVAVIHNKVVGYVHANDYDTIYAPHMKNIMGIAVSKDYKRQGIGKALLNEIEKWAKDTGAKGIRLVSGSSRKGAHAFYHQCGYSGDRTQLNLKKMF